MTINSVNTNVGALVALQSLNKTNRQLAEVQDRISTGFRVNAKNDAASFAISEGLNGDLKALGAIDEQLSKARGVVNVAIDTATLISGKLGDAKALLTKLADESVTGSQRDQYNNDYAALKTEIANFISEAEFNGFNLIDGSVNTFSTIQNVRGDQLSISGFDLGSQISDNLTAVADASAAQDLLSATGSFADAQTNIANTLSALGNGLRSIQGQQDFVNILADATEVGIGNIIDADLAKESARLQAVQIRQQLGTQSLGIANSAPAILLGLFG